MLMTRSLENGNMCHYLTVVQSIFNASTDLPNKCKSYQSFGDTYQHENIASFQVPPQG